MRHAREGSTRANTPYIDADYATGLVDIIDNGQYLRQRVTLIHGDKPPTKDNGDQES